MSTIIFFLCRCNELIFSPLLNQKLKKKKKLDQNWFFKTLKLEGPNCLIHKEWGLRGTFHNFFFWKHHSSSFTLVPSLLILLFLNMFSLISFQLELEGQKKKKLKKEKKKKLRVHWIYGTHECESIMCGRTTLPHAF